MNTTITRKFILLHGGVGAIVHELSHELGLGHPWDHNLARANGSSTAESRDSWNWRPFPDQPTGGLHLCVSHSECDGADADPGLCFTSLRAASGFCRNLKVNCSTKGDRVCDTPWDTAPCFQVGSRLGQFCSTTADCLVNGGFRGTSHETQCGFDKRCQPKTCTHPSQCASGLCINGSCSNLFPVHAESCCDLHDDIEPPRNHNVCVEWATGTVGGPTVFSPGVGNATTWPLARNALTYHRPGGRVPGTFTRGQRDKVICRLHYSDEYGVIRRKARSIGEPCSLRPGASVFTYGSVPESRDIAHGACASGVCSVANFNLVTTAECAPSGCSDGVMSQGETDIDCGGICRSQFGNICEYDPGDKLAEGCSTNADCVSGVCTAGRCYPTCSDGKRNGAEVGIEEGGSGFEAGCRRPDGGRNVQDHQRLHRALRLLRGGRLRLGRRLPHQ